MSFTKWSRLVVIGVVLSLTVGCGSTLVGQKDGRSEKADSTSKGVVSREQEKIPSPAVAKEILIAGNQRFTTGKLAYRDLGINRRKFLDEKGQKPLAVVITCSDSRVPPELVFDQGLGDIFVIRTAGNVVDKIALGSLEYALEHLHVPLVVVLGHQHCGAVQATVNGGHTTENIQTIVDKIKPALDKVKASGTKPADLLEETIEANIQDVIAQIRTSPVVKGLESEHKISLVGGEYQLSSGTVEWLR